MPPEDDPVGVLEFPRGIAADLLHCLPAVRLAQLVPGFPLHGIHVDVWQKALALCHEVRGSRQLLLQRVVAQLGPVALHLQRLAEVRLQLGVHVLIGLHVGRLAHLLANLLSQLIDGEGLCLALLFRDAFRSPRLLEEVLALHHLREVVRKLRQKPLLQLLAGHRANDLLPTQATGSLTQSHLHIPRLTHGDALQVLLHLLGEVARTQLHLQASGGANLQGLAAAALLIQLIALHVNFQHITNLRPSTFHGVQRGEALPEVA
mmetsp:Transcript_96761/g.230289  ORF Transcript_96761/g.230289 Transcript_96761/m.230289 type:complete len:262 (+) Transcript_96761:139-924(+)